ncbi:MAG: hypothetical protein AAF267_03230 [Deinococcota bacterium]
MNKILLLLLLSTTPLSFAQPQNGGGNPELRALMEPYTNLTTTIGLLLELEQHAVEQGSDLQISSEQAARLSPLLNELATSAGYSPERATELLDTIELNVLTGEQLIWIDGAFLRREEARARPDSNQDTDPTGTPPARQQRGQRGQQDPQRQQRGPNAGGDIFQRLSAGEPINMFADNENAKTVLDELIALVDAKLE